VKCEIYKIKKLFKNLLIFFVHSTNIWNHWTTLEENWDLQETISGLFPCMFLMLSRNCEWAHNDWIFKFLKKNFNFCFFQKFKKITNKPKTDLKKYLKNNYKIIKINIFWHGSLSTMLDYWCGEFPQLGNSK